MWYWDLLLVLWLLCLQPHYPCCDENNNKHGVLINSICSPSKSAFSIHFIRTCEGCFFMYQIKMSCDESSYKTVSWSSSLHCAPQPFLSPLFSLCVFVCLLHWVLVCLPAVQGRDPPGCAWIIQQPVDHLSISSLVFKLRPVSVRDTERIGHLDPSSHWILYILDFSTEHFKKTLLSFLSPAFEFGQTNRDKQNF